MAVQAVRAKSAAAGKTIFMASTSSVRVERLSKRTARALVTLRTETLQTLAMAFMALIHCVDPYHKAARAACPTGEVGVAATAG